MSCWDDLGLYLTLMISFQAAFFLFFWVVHYFRSMYFAKKVAEKEAPLL